MSIDERQQKRHTELRALERKLMQIQREAWLEKNSGYEVQLQFLAEIRLIKQRVLELEAETLLDFTETVTSLYQ